MFLEIALDLETISNLINLIIKVFLVVMIPGVAILTFILIMYLYRRYKKWSNSEDKEQERIILGRAKKITSYDEELSRQADERKKLEFDLEILRNQKKRLQEDLGESESPEEVPAEEKPSEEMDLSKLNIKQLKQLAKDHKIPMYSKKSKQQLLETLQSIQLHNIPLEKDALSVVGK
jgi:hypothetical protein